MTKELIVLARMSERPEGVCPFEWWIAPFLIDADDRKSKKSRVREEEQLDLFSARATQKLRSK